MNQSAPIALSAIPLTATAILVIAVAFHVRCTWKRERSVYAADLLWEIPFVALLLIVGVFLLGGLVDLEVEAPLILLHSLVLLSCGLLVQARRRVSRAFDCVPTYAIEPFRACFSLIAVALVALVSAWSIDYVWLDSSGSIPVQFFGVTSLVFAAAGLALYFLGQRTGALVTLVPFVSLGFGVAQHFVMEFKGMPIMPADLFALETAGAVAGGYSYVLTPQIVIGMCAVGVCTCVLAFISPGHVKRKANRNLGLVVNAAIGIALVVGMSSAYRSTRLEDVLDAPYDRWMPITTYQTLGFVPAFIELSQDYAISVPEGYEEREAEALVRELAAQLDAGLGTTPERTAAEAQFAELKPVVVVVMNETFVDMSAYAELFAAGYEGPSRYGSLSDALQRGTLMVPALGGGAANTEFEFLTGNTTAFIGAEKYPYQFYDLSEVDSLAGQFADLGYSSIAIHPENPANWRRSHAYD